jgi:hypothetical protein
MTHSDYIQLIMEAAQACTDLDLLDLILRIIAESGN